MVQSTSSVGLNAKNTPKQNRPLKHSAYEDAQGLFTGSLFVGIAMIMYSQAGLLTGGTAGLAFVLHYATDWSFSTVYFLVNLPFYWFSWRHIGKSFTIKTFICVAMLTAITYYGPHYIDFNYLHPALAALAGGLMMGSGVLFLARHQSSLGGATIISLYAQEKCGMQAGKVQMLIDSMIVLLAMWFVPLDKVAWSLLAAVVMGSFLAINHKPGRYTG